MAYKVPPSSSADDDALTVLSTILSGGRSARFYEAIVRQKQLATERVGGRGREPRPRPVQHRGDRRRRASRSPISRRRSTRRSRRSRPDRSPTGRSRRRAPGRASGFVNSVGSSLQRAILLSQYAMFYDKPDLINTRADGIAQGDGGGRAARRRNSISSRPDARWWSPMPKAAAPRREACDAPRSARRGPVSWRASR